MAEHSVPPGPAASPARLPVVYCEWLGVEVLLRLLFRMRRRGTVLFVDGSRPALRVARAIHLFKLHDYEFERWSFTISQATDDHGGCAFTRVERDLLDLAQQVAHRRFGPGTLFRRVASGLDDAKLDVYARKLVVASMGASFYVINGAAWHRQQDPRTRRRAEVFVQRCLAARELRTYGARASLVVRFSRSRWFNRFRAWLPLVPGRGALKSAAPNAGPPPATGPPMASRVNPAPGAVIGAIFNGRSPTFDRGHRSDWFWMLDDATLPPRVVVYFMRTDFPAEWSVVAELARHGVRAVALRQGATRTSAIPVWRPGRAAAATLARLLARGSWFTVVGLMAGRWPFPGEMATLVRFAVQFALWKDFFVSQRVSVNVSCWDFWPGSVPMHLALADTGGVSVSYQWSNLEFPSVTNSSCADVVLGFAPHYEWIWRKNGSAIDTLAWCGYVTDHSFDAARGRAADLRGRLLERGATFVLAYFDENSGNEPGSIIPNAVAAASYQWFLTRVLDDHSLGLVLKPGYPKTLRRRIGDVAVLLDRALATGRCAILEEGHLVTVQYPAEAAQAADLCVGLLISGTAALEAFLAGTPTVFLDLERTFDNPIYSWGGGTVVFRTLAELDAAINAFRRDQGAPSPIGDLSRWAHERDRFRDGQASLRMGRYIGWLQERLKAGDSREAALTEAARRHAAAWGNRAVERRTVVAREVEMARG